MIPEPMTKIRREFHRVPKDRVVDQTVEIGEAGEGVVLRVRPQELEVGKPEVDSVDGGHEEQPDQKDRGAALPRRRS